MSCPLNESIRLIQTKIQRCSLPTGVFTSLLTLFSQAVIPLIYYGMVIGWGVAMTPSRQIMNHVGQDISFVPRDTKRGHHKRPLEGLMVNGGANAVAAVLPWQLLWLPVFSSRSYCLFHDVRVMVEELPPCCADMHQELKAKWRPSHVRLRKGPSACARLGFWLVRGDGEKRARQFTKIWLRFSCRCDEIDIWGSCKVATAPVSSTPGQDDLDLGSTSQMKAIKILNTERHMCYFLSSFLELRWIFACIIAVGGVIIGNPRHDAKCEGHCQHMIYMYKLTWLIKMSARLCL